MMSGPLPSGSTESHEKSSKQHHEKKNKLKTNKQNNIHCTTIGKIPTLLSIRVRKFTTLRSELDDLIQFFEQ